MKFYFYKTTNLINGKFYYGSGQFDNYIGSGIALESAIKKYGKENFTTDILRYFETRQEAYSFEGRFLKLYRISNNPMSYNMKDSGLGGDTLSNHPNIEEIKKKISESGKNRVFTDEHKKKLSESSKRRKGNKPSKFKGLKYEDYLSEEKCIEIKNKLSNHFKGKSYEELYGEEKSKETKRKISKYFKYKKIEKINDYLVFLHEVNLNDLPNYKELNKILKFLNYNNIDCSSFSHIYEYINREKKLSRSNSQKNKRLDKIIEYLDSVDLSDNPLHLQINKALNILIKCGINTEGYIELKEYIKNKKFKNRSKLSKGKKHTEETKKKISEYNKGKKHTEETRKKISESNKNKTLSQDTKEKIKKSLGTKIEIDGVIYYGYLDAERQLGIDRHKIKKLCLDPNEINFNLI